MSLCWCCALLHTAGTVYCLRVSTIFGLPSTDAVPTRRAVWNPAASSSSSQRSYSNRTRQTWSKVRSVYSAQPNGPDLPTTTYLPTYLYLPIQHSVSENTSSADLTLTHPQSPYPTSSCTFNKSFQFKLQL